MDRAVDFYTRALQLEQGPRYGNEWAEIRAPGLTIGLHPRRQPGTGAANGQMSIGFQVRDLRASISELRQHGVAIDDAAIREADVDRIVNFADPDGTPLYLIELRT
jgi:predicted enzyme related to lactoylglutathione lyase